MSNYKHYLSAYELRFHKRRGFDDKNINSDITVEKIADLIKETYDDYEICKNTGYVLKIKDSGEKTILKDNTIRIYLNADSGRRGRPLKVYPLKKGKTEFYNFGSNSASTYQNNIFLYQFSNRRMFCIFHRVGNFGCKTIFNALVNEILKSKGIVMEMIWLSPRGVDNVDENYEINGVNFIFRESKNNSDIADDLLKKERKQKVIKELKIDLTSSNFSNIKEVLNNHELRKLDKKDILEKVKPLIKNDEYNDLNVRISFNGMRRTVSWDDLDDFFLGFEITNKLKNSGDNFFEKLVSCTDEYIFNLAKELFK